jgi:hypothetical protein
MRCEFDELMANPPKLLIASNIPLDEVGVLAWDVGHNADLLTYSDDAQRVEWRPRMPEQDGAYPPAWVPTKTLAKLHSGRYRLDFVVEEMAEAQLGVGFMLVWDAGLDWGFFGYLGAGRTAWAYDPLTGDIVTATKSICGGLPVFPDKRRGVVTLELELPRTKRGKATFIVDGVATPEVRLPVGAVVTPAACLLRESQRIALANFERSTLAPDAGPDAQQGSLTRFSARLDQLWELTEPIDDVRTLRGALDELVDIASADPDNRSAYVRLLCGLMTEEFSGPWEALPYLVHRLRWPELGEHGSQLLREVVSDRGSAPCPKSYLERWLEAIIDASSERWIERDLWQAGPGDEGALTNVYSFVVSESGELTLAPRFRTLHVELVEPGGFVRVSGEVHYKDGEIVYLTTRDTHYMRLAEPTRSNLEGMKQQALIAFSNLHGQQIDPSVFKYHFARRYV